MMAQFIDLTTLFTLLLNSLLQMLLAKTSLLSLLSGEMALPTYSS